MNTETKSTLMVIFTSLLFTLFLIGLFSSGLYLLTGNIWSNILIVTGSVLGIGYLYNLFTIQRFNRFVATKQAEVMKEQQKSFYNIECCKCSKVHSVPVDFSQDMMFKCEDCETPNKIFFALKTGLTTDIPENLSVSKLVERYVDDSTTSS